MRGVIARRPCTETSSNNSAGFYTSGGLGMTWSDT